MAKNKTASKPVKTPSGIFDASEIMGMTPEERDYYGIDETMIKLADSLMGGKLFGKENKIPLESIKISTANTTVTRMTTSDIIIENQPADSELGDLTWISDDNDIVKIDYANRIVAMDVGTAEIYCISGGVESNRLSISVQPAFVEDIILSASDIMRVNGNYRILAKIVPAYGDLTEGITYESSDTDTATIDGRGNVSCSKVGPVTFTVSLGSLVKTILIDIKGKLVTDIDISVDATILKTGMKYDIIKTITPVNGDISEGVMLYSTNPRVASINGDSVIIHQEGEFDLVMSLNGLESRITLQTVISELTGLNVKLGNNRIKVRGATDIMVAPIPLISSYNEDDTVVTIGDNDILELSGNGRILIGKRAGTTSILYENGNISHLIDDIVVQNEPVVGITPSVISNNLLVGETSQISNELKPYGAENIDTFEYSSKDESIATVDEHGLITAISDGYTTIDIKLGIHEESLDISVSRPTITGLVIATDLTDDSLNRGDTGNVLITPTPAEGDISPSNINYSTSNYNIAIVNKEGLITGISNGTARITATTNGISAYVDVTVNITPLLGIDVIIEDDHIEVSNAKKVKLELTPKNATILGGVHFTSDDDVVISIDNEGIYTANEVGITNINVECDGHNVSKQLTAYRPPSVDLFTDFGAPLMEINLPRQINAQPIPANGYISTIAYESDDDDIITISDTGNMVAKHPGTTNVRARMDSFVEEFTIISFYATLEGIDLTPNNNVLNVGDQVDTVVSAIPSHAPLFSMAYHSANEDVATVDGNGVVTAIGKGMTTITASTTNKSAVINVTVL